MRNLEFLLLKNKIKLDKMIREKDSYQKINSQSKIIDKHIISKVNLFIK